MNIVSPRLNVGLIMIAVSPRQPPQPYLRHGCGSELRGPSREQSLRLSTDNEQNLCNLAHCWLLCSVCPHLDASVKVGLTECRKLSKLASW